MKTVVLVSGGIDSALNAYNYATKNSKEEVEKMLFVGFDYGQNHKRELSAAKKICKRLKVPFTKAKIQFVINKGNTNLVGNENLERNDSISNYFVPGRNMQFLMSAAQLAYDSNNPNEEIKIVVGSNADDIAHPDCSVTFYEATEKAIGEALGARVRIATPLINKTKREIIFKLVQDDKRTKILEETWSCYRSAKADDKECGECPACKLKREAIAKVLETPNLCVGIVKRCNKILRLNGWK